MKKIGIITLCSNNNFGNKLQNYALKKLLESNKDFIVETIWVENSFKSNKLKSLLKMYKNKYSDYFVEYDRNKYFIKFTKKYLSVSNKLIFNDDLNKIKHIYDYYVVGSDQVWNYNFIGNFDIYFMLSVEREKCISYAASVGVDSIPDKLKQCYIDGFNHIDKLSVRENRGKEIIEELTRRKDIEVLVDPTMLLKDEDWDKISKKPKQLKADKYILNYFLGDLSQERKKEIDKIAKENNCEVINILDKNSPFYQTGPSEFLWLEKHAFLICTDSFHSSVFAILYNRPFVVFNREDKTVSMNSRIETLLCKFKLKNREFTGYITEENLNHDYTEAYEILEKERIRSKEFLKKALNMEEE